LLHFTLERATSLFFVVLNKVFHFYYVGLHDSPAMYVFCLWFSHLLPSMFFDHLAQYNVHQ
ncbi:MAG: hypothetical protein ACTH8A_06750, partial [Serratia proteamaculans]